MRGGPALAARKSRRTLGSQAGWTAVDQAISSINNAALTLLVARSVDAKSFGAFGVAFVAFTFMIGIARAVITDPLVIRFSAAGPADQRRAIRDSAGASALFGVAAGGLCAAAGAVLGGELQVALTAVAVSVPTILVQDAWRHAFFAVGRPRAAAANDLTCATVQFGLIALLLATHRDSVLTLVLAWGLGTAAGTLYGVIQLSAWPRPHGSLRWVRTQWPLGGRLGLDYLVNMGAYNLTLFVISAMLGLSTAGAFRAAQTLLGPLQVLFASLTAFVVPTFVRRSVGGPQRLRRPATLISVAAGGTAATWVGVLLLLPHRVGEMLLGDSWEGARQVLLGTGLGSVGVGLVIGAYLSLKALGRGGTLLRVTAVQAPLFLLLAVVGAQVADAQGAAMGLALAQAIGTVAGWSRARAAMSAPPPTPS